MFRSESAPCSLHVVDFQSGPIGTDSRFDGLVWDPLHRLRVGRPLGEELHLQHGMLPDEPLHVLGLVARGVVGEQDHLLRSTSLRVLDEVRQVEFVLSAPPLRVGVEDEPVPPLGPEERDERVPSLVVARGKDPPLLSTRHPFCLDLRVEREPGLVLECYENPLFSRAGVTCLYRLISRSFLANDGSFDSTVSFGLL